MNYTMNEIKVELFDKCHELVYEYMNRHAKQYKDETFEEYHERFGKHMTSIFEDLSKGKLFEENGIKEID
jgi:hypothetical protein